MAGWLGGGTGRGGREFGQLVSVIGINPGTRSGAKLYSQTNRTAVFDQTRPTAEREAFGAPMSQTSSIRVKQMRLLRLGQAERERAKRSGTKARCSVQLLPDPKAAFFGDFLFCPKRKLLASTRQVDSTDGVVEEKRERSGDNQTQPNNRQPNNQKNNQLRTTQLTRVHPPSVSD